MDSVWDERRKVLQENLKAAALALVDHTGSAAFMVPLEDGLYLAVGGLEDLPGMIERRLSETNAQ